VSKNTRWKTQKS